MFSDVAPILVHVVSFVLGGLGVYLTAQVAEWGKRTVGVWPFLFQTFKRFLPAIFAGAIVTAVLVSTLWTFLSNSLVDPRFNQLEARIAILEVEPRLLESKRIYACAPSERINVTSLSGGMTNGRPIVQTGLFAIDSFRAGGDARSNDAVVLFSLSQRYDESTGILDLRLEASHNLETQKEGGRMLTCDNGEMRNATTSKNYVDVFVYWHDNP